jgi:uncharacterized protein YdaU (DUF1376 family)
MHYYKFEISVWNLHTAHLTLVEEAVYRRLIDHYYDTEQPIGSDFNAMLRRLRLEDYRDEVVIILNEFFQQVDNGFRNKHCDQKIADYKKQKKINKINGKSGGRPKKQLETHSVTDGLPLVTLTTNNKQETINNKQLTNLTLERFELFWKSYPRKISKDSAKKSWLKINPDDELMEKIVKAVSYQKLSEREEKFIPHASTWLNGKRWEDEIASNVTKFDGRLRGAK